MTVKVIVFVTYYFNNLVYCQNIINFGCSLNILWIANTCLNYKNKIVTMFKMDKSSTIDWIIMLQETKDPDVIYIELIIL